LLALGGFGIVFWVPLHSDNEVTRAVFHRFDDAVRGLGNDDKFSCDIL
jgi:hypothetical protein